MDDIILRCAVRHLRVRTNRNYVENQVVKRTYGFNYDRHFRKMLIALVGIVKVEKIERKVDGPKSDQMKATLDSLVTVRNAEAHTHVRGTTRTINAPSVSLRQFVHLYEGLVEYDRVVRSMRF